MKKTIDTTRQFQYLKEKELGTEINVIINGDEHTVTLLRRGRQKVRVKRPDRDEEELVPLTDVILP
jgi:hypothetical protein